MIDEAGAAQRILPKSKQKKTISIKEIEDIIAKIARIPPKNVSSDDRSALKTLERDLKAVVFGQDKAIEALSSAIKMARSGLGSPQKPIGSFLFSGPTGVGKTEVARQLAYVLGIELIRFDMSEYMERHAVSRLIGAPPGYVGFEQGGLLTEQITKHPYCVLLLDEIEKAHPDIYQYPAAGHGSRHADRQADLPAHEVCPGVVAPYAEDEQQDPAALGPDLGERRHGGDGRARGRPRGARTRSGRRRPPRRSSRTRRRARHEDPGARTPRPRRAPPRPPPAGCPCPPPADRRLEHEGDGQCRPEQRERLVASRLEQAEHLPAPQRRHEGQHRRDGRQPDHRATRRTGTRTSAERARVFSMGAALAAEPAGAAGELQERLVERLRAEVRPEAVREPQLGVRGLPDQEVADPLLAAGPDHEVRVGQARGIQRLADRTLVHLLGGDAGGGDPPEGVHELRAAGVVPGDVELEPRAGGGAGQGILDRWRVSSGSSSSRPSIRTRTPWAASSSVSSAMARARRSNRPATSSSERAQFSRLKA